MAVPSSYKVSTTDNTDTTPVEKFGGVAIGITSTTNTAVGNPITVVLPVSTQALDGSVLRSVVVDTAYTQAADTGGTFAYNQSAFMIRGHATTVNGQANTTLRIVGGDQHLVGDHRRIKPIGQKLLTAMRARYWQPLGISGQRTNWSTAPSAVTATFYDPATGSATTQDEALGTSRAVPGELTFLVQSGQPFQDDYKAKTGG